MIKQNFINRLNQALSRLGLPEHGRQAWLAEKVGVSRAAVWKWYSEEESALPRYEILIKISEITGVSIDCLLKGTSNQKELLQVPVYKDYAVASKDSFKTAIANIPAAVDMQRPFAAVIDDDSMMTYTSTSFPVGTIMFYDSIFEAERLTSGSLVYAAVNNGNNGVHRVYTNTGGKIYLKPLNATYENEFDYNILGVFKYAIIGLSFA